MVASIADSGFSLLTSFDSADILRGPMETPENGPTLSVHGGASLLSEPRVLILDRSAESRETLRTALQRNGTQIIEAGRPQQALMLARRHQPDLIVLDMESDVDPDDTFSSQLSETVQERQSLIVVLATSRRKAAGFANSEFVAKPYHYRPLIRRIEQLLADSNRLARSA